MLDKDKDNTNNQMSDDEDDYDNEEVKMEHHQQQQQYKLFLSWGVGVFSGFMIFLVILELRFGQQWMMMEARHNTTLVVMQQSLENAVLEKDTCVEQDLVEATTGLASLKGRLESQSMLLEQHQRALLEQQEQAKEQCRHQMETSLQQEQEQFARKCHEDLTRQSDQFAVELDDFKRTWLEEWQQREESLTRHLQEQFREEKRELLKKRDEYQHSLAQDLFHQKVARETFEQRLDDCYRESRHLQERMQDRQGVLIKEEHGNGPYYVQFTFLLPPKQQKSPQPNQASFVVEIASRKVFPHTVFTFLELVEYQLYDKRLVERVENNLASLVSTTANSNKNIPSGALQIGKSTTSHEEPEQGQPWGDILTTLGYGSKPILMHEIEQVQDGEEALFPCAPYSIRFVHGGPALQIFLSDKHNQQQQQPQLEREEEDDSWNDVPICFGKVVRGAKTVSQIVDALAQGETVSVVSVRNLIL